MSSNKNKKIIKKETFGAVAQIKKPIKEEIKADLPKDNKSTENKEDK